MVLIQNDEVFIQKNDWQIKKLTKNSKEKIDKE